MPILRRYRAIYIHIPRTAGTSLHRALSLRPEGQHNLHGPIEPRDRERHAIAENNWNHLSLVEVRRLVAAEHFREFFKFSFVRNPWDRAVSLFSYRLLRRESAGAVDDLAFADWLQRRVRRGRAKGRSRLSQLPYLCDERGSMAIDFLGRFERLEEDWSTICDRLGIRAPLPLLNRSPHAHYSTYYDRQTRQLVAEECRWEVEVLGYRFGGG